MPPPALHPPHHPPCRSSRPCGHRCHRHHAAATVRFFGAPGLEDETCEVVRSLNLRSFELRDAANGCPYGETKFTRYKDCTAPLLYDPMANTTATTPAAKRWLPAS